MLVFGLQIPDKVQGCFYKSLDLFISISIPPTTRKERQEVSNDLVAKDKAGCVSEDALALNLTEQHQCCWPTVFPANIYFNLI